MLHISSAQEDDRGVYHVVVKNPHGATTSMVATLTVVPLEQPPPVDNADWYTSPQC